MSIVLCIILFVVVAVAQLLFTKKATHKVVKYVPMLVSAIGTVAAIGLHAYALITYHMGTASEIVVHVSLKHMNIIDALLCCFDTVRLFIKTCFELFNMSYQILVIIQTAFLQEQVDLQGRR